MFRTLVMLPVLLATLMALGATPAAAGDPEATVFSAKGPDGEVWVSLDLTRQRLDETFVPLVVAVRNEAGGPSTLERSSFTLTGSDGRPQAMPSLEALREGYRKESFDRTALRLYGMPFGTRLDFGRVAPSEFFPTLSQGSGVRLDTVVLSPLHWTVDILYFPRPKGLAEGQEVTLTVAPKGWETPVKVRFRVQ